MVLSISSVGYIFSIIGQASLTDNQAIPYFVNGKTLQKISWMFYKNGIKNVV
jgi:hypothetical protein